MGCSPHTAASSNFAECFRAVHSALEKLKFLCAPRNAIFFGMSAILKDEEFVAVEAAVCSCRMKLQ